MYYPEMVCVQVVRAGLYVTTRAWHALCQWSIASMHNTLGTLTVRLQ